MTDDLQTLADRALADLNAGRFAAAIAGFESLLARQPDLPDFWYNLGLAQRRERRFEAALASYRQALDRGVAEPEQVYLNRAVINAADLGRAGEAEADLQAALKIAPRYFPAWLNLGGLHEDRGERDKARAAYQRALEVKPGDPLALTRLAVLSKIENPGHPLIGKIRSKIADPPTQSAEQADLGFALGQVLDGAGAYDEAFEAYARANAASAAIRSPNDASYDRRVEGEMTDRIMRSFATPQEGVFEPEQPTPLFICGMFRSGSTLAERVLARHSRVTAGGELNLLPEIVADMFAGYPEAAGEADDAAIARFRKAYLDALAKLHPGADIVTDKRPVNFRYIGLIRRAFPTAKIVDTMREPIDNCLSMWFAHLGVRQPYATDLGDIAHWYREYRRLMAHWRAHYPDSIHTLDYDALVADPEPHIRALIGFCGLDWEEACLEPHKADNAVRTASAWQVRQPLYKSSSGRWRNYERHIAPLIEAFSTGGPS